MGRICEDKSLSIPRTLKVPYCNGWMIESGENLCIDDIDANDFFVISLININYGRKFTKS